ncbi:hypothetical protein JOM56_003268 [Amanita muscaria]
MANALLPLRHRYSKVGFYVFFLTSLADDMDQITSAAGLNNGSTSEQSGQLEINKVAIPHSLTLGFSNEGISALPPNAPTLSAFLDQGSVAISSNISSLGPSSTARSSSPPHTCSRSTKPVTITVKLSSKHPTTTTASGTTAISIVSTSSTTCTEIAEAEDTAHLAVLNLNGLRVAVICVSVFGAVITILFVLVLMLVFLVFFSTRS